MNPHLVWLCCVLVTGSILAWAWRSAAHEDRLRFQQTAADAARTEATVAEDVAARKAARQQEATDDLTACLAIWNITPHDIPHQTRRTEEDQ